ncbi:MAG: hypothetical protein Q8P15_02930 [Nanoarchaeota archaeon]|nr:hypothetical protein [Nanoarchaeota archaeon]
MATIQEVIETTIPYYVKRAKDKEAGLVSSVPETEHTLIYDSSSETLEPVYFFILDLMNEFGLAPEKLVDNFMSSPGSGHFSEIGQKATIMQQQASKVMGDINTVLRSVLNIIYDLKEFKIRLQSYDDLKDPAKKDAAILSLKQIWMDKVDMQKGNSSIKAMALGQAGFQTLIDAFLFVKNSEDADKIDLNDRIKRILKPRIEEFNIWVSQSEKELKKRYEIERTYLKSQVNNLKLYSKWAKPYLIAANKLAAKESGTNPAVVNVFNTILLELTLLGKNKIDVKKSALAGDLPEEFQKLKTKRDYHSCVLVDFKFRGIPQRISQQPHYVFGGLAEITFRGYALNDDELEKLKKEIDKSDVEDTLRLIEGATTKSIEQIQEEIDFFLNEKEEEETKKENKDESNPFSALFGRYEKKSEKKEAEKKSDSSKSKNNEIKKDDFKEEYIRKLASGGATETAFKLFDIYKKAHGMESFT